MPKKKKVVIIVQRFGKEVVGGSEALAFKVASLLSEYTHLEVLTTTAKDHTTWDDYFLKGEEILENILVKRFRVNIKRSEYWKQLHQLLLKASSLTELRKLPLNFCIEWIKHQGPYSFSLFDYLSKNSYDVYLFFTYLYPTTYFGIDYAPPEKTFLIPTYHPEPFAYLPIMQKYKPLKHLFLTPSEARLAQRIYENMPEHEILGFGLEDLYPQYSHLSKKPYVIYAGRLEEGKGINQLLKYFSRFYTRYGKISLYLIGKASSKLSLPPGVIYKGFVSEKEKYQLLRQAKALIHPSPYESLGIVLLEAFMLGTPALVNASSEVLVSHINSSGAGYTYSNYEEFEKGLLFLLEENTQKLFSEKARAYYLSHYTMDIFKKKLFSFIEVF